MGLEESYQVMVATELEQELHSAFGWDKARTKKSLHIHGIHGLNASVVLEGILFYFILLHVT